jgi:hypothetical protein
MGDLRSGDAVLFTEAEEVEVERVSHRLVTRNLIGGEPTNPVSIIIHLTNARTYGNTLSVPIIFPVTRTGIRSFI